MGIVQGNLIPRGRKAVDVVILDDLVCVHDDGYEEWEDNVDEETDEGVEINSTVHPDGAEREKTFHYVEVFGEM